MGWSRVLLRVTADVYDMIVVGSLLDIFGKASQ